VGLSLDILRCPLTSAPLAPDGNGRAMVGGGRSYPIRRHGPHRYVDFRIDLPDAVRQTQQAIYDSEDSRYLAQGRTDKRAFMDRFIARRVRGSVKSKEALFLRAFRALHLPPGARLLEIGCNDGRYLNLMSQLHGCRGIGVDLSQKAIQAALEGAPAFGATEFHAADSTALPFRGQSFDGIISLDVFEHLGHAGFRKTMAECARVLKPGAPLMVYIVSQKDRFTLHETLRSITDNLVGVDAGEGHAFENFIHPDFFREVAQSVGFRVEGLRAYHGFWTLFGEEYLHNAVPRLLYPWLELLDRPLTSLEYGNGFLAVARR
jgi:ubiquinone/menaquinone biosynthesis C-methylase UbiE